MELLLKRSLPIPPDALPGELFIQTTGLAHAAFTLERVAVAISTGRFPIDLYDSPHFNRLMPRINVPGRAYILIHWGDYPQNSDGCVLVGQTQDPSTGFIYGTQAKWRELFPAIEASVEGEGCWITVE